MRTNALDEIVLGRHDVEVDPGPRHRVADGLVLLLGRGQQAAAELRIARIDEQLLAGLGVLDEQQPGIGELVFAGIDQPDGDDLVPLGEPQQRALPSRLADEVGDQHDERPAAHESRRVCRAAC